MNNFMSVESRYKMTSQREAFEKWNRATFIKITGGMQVYSVQNEVEKSASKLGFEAGWQAAQADQATTIAQLTESLDFCKGSNLRLDKANDDLEDEIEQLELDNAKMHEALRRYGKHDSRCGENVACIRHCDCGFHKALGETK